MSKISSPKGTMTHESGTPKINLSPTFNGTTIEFARYCNEQFQSEESFKGLLGRLVQMIASFFGSTEINYLSLDGGHLPVGIDRNVKKFPPLPSVSPETVAQICSSLNSMMLAEKEFGLGLTTINIGEDNFFWTQFDESENRRGVLIWRAVDKFNFTPNINLSSHDTKPMELLDFIVRSAQQTSLWFKRLDNSRALLYEDDVTGLFNYRYLDVAIDNELRRLHRYRSAFSLLFIDLDNFKQVNDQYGHLTGSSVLKQVGIQIKAAVRDVDSVIRYGGDEFVVVLVGANSRQALLAAERVRSKIAGQEFTTEITNQRLHITASVGVACCPDHARDKSTIIQLADETMYAAKRSGKNRVVIVEGNSKQVSKSNYVETMTRSQS